MRTEEKPRIRPRRVLTLLDRLIFCALLAVAVLIPLRRQNRFAVFAVLIGAAFVLLAVAWENRSAANRRRRRLADAMRAIRLERILLLPDEAIKAVVGEPSLVLLRSADPSIGEITAAIRTRPRVLIVLCDPVRFAPVIETHAPSTRLLGADALLKAVPVPATEREAEERLSFAERKTAKPVPVSLRLRGNHWKFLALGTLLLVLSLVWKHKIYYRLLSGLCFGMSVISGSFGFQKARRNFGIFLDKIDK